jgi:hypothetical protein
MKYSINLLVFLTSLMPLMSISCEMSLTGKWKLDFEYYLNSLSKGDADARQRLIEIWDGQPFIKIEIDETKGKFSQKWEGGWSSFDFDYQILPADKNSCVFIITAYDDSETGMSESMEIWGTPEGFCWRPLINAEVTDCYVKDRE